MPRSSPPIIPPLPSTGGTYVLTGNEWKAEQQTVMPGEVVATEPAPLPDPPQPED